MTNPNNFPGATLSIVGYAGGPVELRDIGSTGRQEATLNISVGKGYKNKQTNEWVDQGVDWYTLTALPDYAQQNWPDVARGDKVRVDDGKLTLRSYKNKDGEPGVDAKIQYGTLVVVESKASRSGGGGGFASGNDATPW